MNITEIKIKPIENVYNNSARIEGHNTVMQMMNDKAVENYLKYNAEVYAYPKHNKVLYALAYPHYEYDEGIALTFEKLEEILMKNV